MITNSGRTAIGTALAEGLVGSVAIGIGVSDASVEDTHLDFETYRAEVRARAYDPISQSVIYSATIPSDISTKISEIGLFSATPGDIYGGFVSTFSEDAEDWTAGTWTEDNIRYGTTGLTVSQQTASTQSTVRQALVEARNSDIVQVAYHGTGGNVEIRLTGTDEDYFSMTFPVGNGYNVVSKKISELVPTGVPSVQAVSGITVIHSGTGNITLDAIRVTSDISGDNLIHRQKLAEVKSKAEGIPMDVDIPIEVTV